MSVCLCSQLNMPQYWCYTTNLKFPCHTCTNIHKHTNPCPNSELITAAGLPGFSPWKVANRLKDSFLGWTLLPMRANEVGTHFISEGCSIFTVFLHKLWCQHNKLHWQIYRILRIIAVTLFTQKSRTRHQKKFDVATLQHKKCFVHQSVANLFVFTLWQFLMSWWCDHFHLIVVK